MITRRNITSVEINPDFDEISHFFERQEGFIGNQCGGRVFLFLQTDDFWRDYHAMKAKGVHFCQEPREEEYRTVVVFEDLYGNRWDLCQNTQD